MTPLPSALLPRDERDRQLSPSLSAKDAAGVLTRHAAETAALWDDPALTCTRDIAFGPAPRTRLDIVRPAGPGPFPCLAFIHGGFWQEGDKSGSGFAARALSRAGWATALIGYTLAPEARLTQIVDEVGKAVRHLGANAAALRIDPARLVVGGHSAGGHLSAALVCGKAGNDVAERIAGAVLISGVYDLAPIAKSYVNDAVGMDADEMHRLSVMADAPVRDIPVHMMIGADEPAAFLEQTDALHANWSSVLTRATLHRAAGRDHFDILDELANPHSPSFKALMEMTA
ncbi:MAG: alpha/beta hydrolase [Paracoccaceae bacterium]